MNNRLKSTILITFTLVGLNYLFSPAFTHADEFNCFQTGNCAPPALFDSSQCLAGQDYTINAVDVQSSDVVVLSPHGGKIELKTSNIAEDIANLYNWNLYDFTAHGTSSCLDGLSNYKRLHITSTHFDEPQALALVSSHPKSVSIHGYGNSRGYSSGTICVGGKNTAQVSAFIDYIETNKNSFTGYELQAVNATQARSGDICEGLKGTSSSNIVNKNSNGMGLQLELNKVMRKDLVKSSSTYDELRNVVYGAISHAMNQ